MNRREALTTLSRGAALGALAGTAVVAVSCQPVEAPAAEADPLLTLINEYRMARSTADAMALATSAERKACEAYMASNVDPLFRRLARETPAATTAAGALAAVGLVHEGIAEGDGECVYDAPLLLAAMRFLEWETRA